MKQFNKITRVIFMVLSIFMVVSCQKDIADVDGLRESNYKNIVSTAAPEIKGFFAHSSYITGDTIISLEKVNLGDYVVVVGENLEGTTSLIFNSDTLDMAEVYSQWNMIVMKVPDALPLEITNTFTCITKLGRDEVTLGLQLPDAVFTSLENEFVAAGTNSAKIMGANFSVYGFTTDRSSVVMYNQAEGYEETITVTYASDTELVVNIPADAPDNSLIKFILDGEEHEQKIYYRPTDLLIFGNSELTNNVSIPSGLTVDYTDGTGSGEPACLIPSLNGGNAVKYFRVIGTLSAWQVIIQVFLPAETQAFVVDEDKSGADYDLVYEICTSGTKPIPAGNTYKGQFTDAGLVGMWNDFGVNEINTGGEWVTYRTDLSAALGTTVGSSTAMKDKLIIKTAIAIADADHSFANFRIVPKKP
ncbi:MAG: hypothetical protein R3Y22_06045 [Bacteroidales bacterium]